jgi:hypothetical protein
MTHALECQRADGLSVDLHWAFRNRPGIRFDYDAIWDRRNRHPLVGLDYPVPSDEDQILLMLVGIALDIDRSHCRIRGLWDVYLMLHGLVDQDWPVFLARREKEGLLPLVVNVLALVLYRLDCRDEFPVLVHALDGYRDMLLAADASQVRRILTRSRQSLANRWWFARLQPSPIVFYGMWWGGTLPLRFLLGRNL